MPQFFSSSFSTTRQNMSKGGNATENFVVFGTGFPETTDKDRRAGRTDAGQFVPTWKQEARDEQGRRRFHGAFTGGFSAGYFNTVGSKEGKKQTAVVLRCVLTAI